MVHPLLFTIDRSISKSFHAIYISTRRCVSHLHGLCMLCFVAFRYPAILPTPSRVTSLLVGQPYDVPSISEATLNRMSKALCTWNEEVWYKYIQYSMINPYLLLKGYAVFLYWKAPTDFSCFDLIGQKDFLINRVSLLVQFVIALHLPTPELYEMIDFKHPCPKIRYLYITAHFIKCMHTYEASLKSLLRTCIMNYFWCFVAV